MINNYCTERNFNMYLKFRYKDLSHFKFSTATPSNSNHLTEFSSNQRPFNII